MARYLGPIERRALSVGPDGRIESLVGRTYTLFTDEACTQLADVATFNPQAPTVPGATITGSKVTVDRDSNWPLFWFPDEVTTLWAAHRSGRKVRLTVTVPGGPGGGDTVYVSGISGTGSTDNGPAIQNVLDALGETGNTKHREVVVEAPGAGVIFINSTVQVRSDHTTLTFSSPVVFGATGRIRLNGELVETPASSSSART